MERKKVTSSDVAKRAGVSQATVSMVLNKKYNVSFSKEVIRRVEEAAQELGYELPKRRVKKEEPAGKASRCVLSESDQPVLCHAFAGDRVPRNGTGIRAFRLQHTAEPGTGRAVSENASGAEPAGSDLHM